MSTDRAGTLVARMDEWRQSLGMDHRAFARHLGISEGYWSLLRRGKRPASFRAEKLVARVLREKPEFEFYLTTEFRQRLTARDVAAPARRPKRVPA